MGHVEKNLSGGPVSGNALPCFEKKGVFSVYGTDPVFLLFPMVKLPAFYGHHRIEHVLLLPKK